MLRLRASLARSVQKCCALCDTGGWQHSEAIKEQLVETKSQRDRYDKQLEERIKAAIMLGKKVQVNALQ